MIQVNQINKDFGNKRVLHDISFEVKKGDILGFLGPNGAGKTTTMRIITGFMPATSGNVTVAGFDVFENPIEAKSKIGYLPELPPIYPEMSVRNYLKFVGGLKGLSGAELNSRIDDVVEKVGIAHVMKRLSGKLSKGYRQRVGLAQALIHDPEVLVLDEPTAGLDPKQIIEARNLIKSLSGDHTIILSTHILPEVSMTCDRVIIIDDGRITAQDTPEELSEKVKGVSRISVATNGPEQDVVKALMSIDGVLAVKPSTATENDRTSLIVDSRNDVDLKSKIAQVVVEKGWELHEIKLIEVSLEDVFIKLTTKETGEA